jgi:tetratricopeptide (TPR) repeat protein
LSTRAEAIATPPSGASPNSPWIYQPWLDLLIGCGAWSAPLLLVAAFVTPAYAHAWGVGFYFLALLFNYPHFMATIYRAYHTRESFERYKIFTLHVTLLVALTAVLLHASPRLLPWIFTLYICWSPWHYSGQNYGLLQMFLRRSGATVTSAERHWLRAAFIASYILLLASFETGGSFDPLIKSLGLPASITLPARVVLAVVFFFCGAMAFRRLLAERGAGELAAPLTLFTTQFLWFVLPTLLELHANYQVPQTRYSSGVLAVLHSAQYLWITSYYQKREYVAAGKTDWRLTKYFITLIAGGIALFIPGPWLVSYLFHFDFTTSFLIFTSLVNLHHFLLDGAIWKLRDTKVSSLLTESTVDSSQPDARSMRSTSEPKRRFWQIPAFQIGLVALLFLWGALDQVRFALGTDDASLASLQRAAQMNPYDSITAGRIAQAQAKQGQTKEAIASLEHAVAINPTSIALQQATARALIQNGRFQDAYTHYQNMLKYFPNEPDALVNSGLLAMRLGKSNEAITSWEHAAAVAPYLPNSHLYLAQASDQEHDPATAAVQWEAYLRTAERFSDNPVATKLQRSLAMVRLGDDYQRINQQSSALSEYQKAIAFAHATDNPRVESLALAHLAGLQEKTDVHAAAQSFQRALALDTQSASQSGVQKVDPRSEAFDWFDYGQLLAHHGAPDELSYACFLRAENLLSSVQQPAAPPLAAKPNPELQAVQAARSQLASKLGARASAVAQDLPSYLTRAVSLPTSSLN